MVRPAAQCHVGDGMADTIRLDKLLGHTGWGTRKEIRELCRSGAVAVNGISCRDSSLKVQPGRDTVTVKGEPVSYEKFYYLMLYKPEGILSATEDPHARTVIDLLPRQFSGAGPFPVGRLDKDTTGLLLLTNDGQWAHRITSPKKHVPKVYIARVAGSVPGDIGERFAAGLVLDDGLVCLPAKAVCSGEGELTITVQEGKFHQVKRMCAAVGLTVEALHRVRIGSLSLDETLTPGTWRSLTETERDAVFRSAETD